MFNFIKNVLHHSGWFWYDKKCPRICHFCIHYDFNGDEDGVYLGCGFCKKRHIDADPEDYCNLFYCKTCNKKNLTEGKE
jgi:ethanolamine ammonia-lyase large subunit